MGTSLTFVSPTEEGIDENIIPFYDYVKYFEKNLRNINQMCVYIQVKIDQNVLIGT